MFVFVLFLNPNLTPLYSPSTKRRSHGRGGGEGEGARVQRRSQSRSRNRSYGLDPDPHPETKPEPVRSRSRIPGAGAGTGAGTGAWSRSLEPGAWSQEPGAWSLELGAWSLGPEPEPVPEPEPERLKNSNFWFFYGFSVFLSKITFALEDRFLWFLGVCISTFSHKNGYRKFQLLKLSRKNFVARNCGPDSIAFWQDAGGYHRFMSVDLSNPHPVTFFDEIRQEHISNTTVNIVAAQ